jgi:hydrogenase expression/formation protein HypE
VAVVAGDTKVVPRGKADKIFINTTGVGPIRNSLEAERIRPGDRILINGNIAEHGLAVLLAREKLSFKARIKSDCNSLWPIVKSLLQQRISLRFMRDPTRGGVNAALHEIASLSGLSFLLDEQVLPASAACRTLADLLGLELLDMANEGKMLFFVAEQDAQRCLRLLRRHPLGRRASLIGRVLKERKARVYLNTAVGGRKLLAPPRQESIPRIC